MEPDMELYKTWIEYLTPAAGCNTTALAECMVEEDNFSSTTLLQNLATCSVKTSGCTIKVVNQTFNTAESRSS
jgi:hypothetical protein